MSMKEKQKEQPIQQVQRIPPLSSFEQQRNDSLTYKQSRSPPRSKLMKKHISPIREKPLLAHVAFADSKTCVSHLEEQQQLHHLQSSYKNNNLPELSRESSAKWSQEFLSRLCSVADTSNKHSSRLLCEKYRIEDVISILQRDLIAVEKAYQQLKQYSQTSQQNRNNSVKGISLIDFIFLILSYADIPAHESIYLIVAGIDFFEAVNRQSKSDPSVITTRITQESSKKGTHNKPPSSNYYIRFEDLTLYLCENHPVLTRSAIAQAPNLNELPIDIRIPTRVLPPPKYFHTNTTQRVLRDVDINPPVLLHDSNHLVARINKDKAHFDNGYHKSGMIRKSQYVPQLNQLIVLDSYSDTFDFYSEDCKRVEQIRPKNLHVRGQPCLDFFWSETQMRLGSVFLDNYLVFWDYSDHFSFEKIFQIGETLLASVQQEQTRIWHIDAIHKWVTAADNKTGLTIWNIEDETVAGSIESPIFAKGILNLVEIYSLKMVAIACVDSDTISVWDFIGKKLLFNIGTQHFTLSCIAYFRTYEVILTGGFGNQILVYSIDAANNDANRVSELIGHVSIVTAFKGVEGTPIVVSSDDKFNIKVWDIRTCKCVQSIDVNLRSTINAISSSSTRVFFQSSRVTSFEFERSSNKPDQTTAAAATATLNNNNNGIETIAPIGTSLNQSKNELIVCTWKDLRFFRADSGKLLKVFSFNLNEQDDGVTCFSMLDGLSRILVGTMKGVLLVYDVKSGELLKSLPSHAGEVTCLEVDHRNKLVLSTATDSSILIQSLTSTLTSQKFRSIANAHLGSEQIVFMEVSVYHNIFITCSSEKVILIWSYEFGKLLASFELEQEADPVAVSIIEGYQLLVIATSKGTVFIVKFNQLTETIDLELIATIDATKSEVTPTKSISLLTQQQIEEVEEHAGETRSQELKQPSLSYISHEKDAKNPGKGTAAIQTKTSKSILSNVSSTSIGNENQSKNQTSSVRGLLKAIKWGNKEENKGSGENQLQQTPSVFVTSIAIDLLELNSASMRKEQSVEQQSQQSLRDLNEQQQKDQESSKSRVVYCCLILALNNGQIKRYDISGIFTKSTVSKVKHCSTQANYNAFRSTEKDNNGGGEEGNYKVQCFKMLKSNAIIKEIAVVNNLNKSKVISKFQFSVFKLNSIKRLQSISVDAVASTSLAQPSSSSRRSKHSNDIHFDQTKNLLQVMHAHNGAVKRIEFTRDYQGVNEFLVSCGSHDQQVRIWSIPHAAVISSSSDEYQLLAVLNIAHPLPIQWDLKVNQEMRIQAYQRKLIYAIQMQSTIVSKYSSRMDAKLSKKLNFSGLLKYLGDNFSASGIELNTDSHRKKQKIQNKNEYFLRDDSFDENESQTSDVEEEKIELMKDAYSKKDFQLNHKNITFQKDGQQADHWKELSGASLRQFDITKRIEESKKRIRIENEIAASNQLGFEENARAIHNEEKLKNHKFLMHFLQDDFRTKVLDPHYDSLFAQEQHSSAKLFSEKLDHAIRDKVKREALHKYHKIQRESPAYNANSGTPKHLLSSNSYAKPIPHAGQSNLASNIHENNNSELIRSPSAYRKSQFKMVFDIETKEAAELSSPKSSQKLIHVNIAIPDTMQSQSPDKNDHSHIQQSNNSPKNNSNRNSSVHTHTSLPATERGGKTQTQKLSQFLKVPPVLQQETSSSSPQQTKNQKIFNSNFSSFAAATVAAQSSVSPQFKSATDNTANTKTTLSPSQRNSINSRFQGVMLSPSHFHSQQQQQQQQQIQEVEARKSQCRTSKINNSVSPEHNNNMVHVHGRAAAGFASPSSQMMVLKKQAKQLFNFGKDVPESNAAATFLTGGEFLIKINSIERNHGMKFKLFEPSQQSQQSEFMSSAKTDRNTNSQQGYAAAAAARQAQLSTSQSLKQLAAAGNVTTKPLAATASQREILSSSLTQMNGQSSKNSKGFNNHQSLSSNRSKKQQQEQQLIRDAISPRRFLDYAAEKSLINASLQEAYEKHTNSQTPEQIKEIFLSKITGEQQRKIFQDQFESAIFLKSEIQPAVTTATTASNEIPEILSQQSPKAKTSSKTFGSVIIPFALSPVSAGQNNQKASSNVSQFDNPPGTSRMNATNYLIQQNSSRSRCQENNQSHGISSSISMLKRSTSPMNSDRSMVMLMMKQKESSSHPIVPRLTLPNNNKQQMDVSTELSSKSQQHTCTSQMRNFNNPTNRSQEGGEEDSMMGMLQTGTTITNQNHSTSSRGPVIPQLFRSTQKKCFQNVLANLNAKLSSARIPSKAHIIS